MRLNSYLHHLQVWHIYFHVSFLIGALINRYTYSSALRYILTFNYFSLDVIVVTHEPCRSEMMAIPKRFGLDLNLEVVCPSVSSKSQDVQEEPGK